MSNSNINENNNDDDDNKNINVRYYKKAAHTACVRAQRFIDGLCVYDDLITLLKRFFSNKEKIEGTGLRFVYKNLKTYVDEYGIIGYIIMGSKLNSDSKYEPDVELGKYTTQLGVTYYIMGT